MRKKRENVHRARTLASNTPSKSERNKLYRKWTQQFHNKNVRFRFILSVARKPVRKRIIWKSIGKDFRARTEILVHLDEKKHAYIFHVFSFFLSRFELQMSRTSHQQKRVCALCYRCQWVPTRKALIHIWYAFLMINNPWYTISLEIEEKTEH